MPAEIIQFPKRRHLKIARSVDLFHCWDKRLDNPFLNSIFKEQTCYVERWFLQVQHLLHMDDEEHPIIQTILSTDNSILDILIECTEKDLKVQQELADHYTSISVEHNLIKLNRWLKKWKSLSQYRQRSCNS
jgi:hypothetical protein